MQLLCPSATIGARVVAVLGVVTATAVVSQLMRDLGRGYGAGRLAALLGLGLDEVDAGAVGLGRAPHDHPHSPAEFGKWAEEAAGPRPFDDNVRHALAGFLAFAVLYLSASVVLAYSTLAKTLRWGALPWLLLHGLSVSSQVARIIIKVANYHAAVPPELQLQQEQLFQNSRPMQVHPDHGEAGNRMERNWREHVREHDREHAVQLQHEAVVGLALAVLYLVLTAYAWLVVLVAHREWNSDWKPRRRRCGPGDDGWTISMSNVYDVRAARAGRARTKEAVALQALAPDEV